MRPDASASAKARWPSLLRRCSRQMRLVAPVLVSLSGAGLAQEAGSTGPQQPSSDCGDFSALIRVVDATGAPVAGASVSSCDSPVGEYGAVSSSSLASRTDLSGFFGAYMLLMLGPEGLATALDGCASLSPGGETDAQGLVRIAWSGQPALVYAAKPDVGTSGLGSLDPAPADSTPSLTLTLRPRGVLQVALADVAGAPVADIVLFMPGCKAAGPRPRQPQPARLAEGGAFAIEVDAPCRGPLFVHAGDRWQQFGVVEVKPGETTRVALTLPRDVQIRGRVVDESGNPVTSGTVRGFPWWVHPGRSTQIDRAGCFVLDAPADDTAFAVEATGISFMSEAPVPVLAGASDAPVTLVVSRLVEIRGRVVDEQGRPIEGIAVDGRVEGDAASLAALRSAGGLEGYKLTNAEGRFAFGRLIPRCPYRIVAGSEDLGRAEARDVLPGTIDLVLTIPSAKPAAH